MLQKIINLVSSTYGSADEIKDIHPQNVIGDLFASIELYYVKFSYTTSRHNPKERNVYITPSAGWENIDDEFYKWVESYNDKHPFRKLSNVKILDSGLFINYSVCL